MRLSPLPSRFARGPSLSGADWGSEFFRRIGGARVVVALAGSAAVKPRTGKGVFTLKTGERLRMRLSTKQQRMMGR